MSKITIRKNLMMNKLLLRLSLLIATLITPEYIFSMEEDGNISNRYHHPSDATENNSGNENGYEIQSERKKSTCNNCLAITKDYGTLECQHVVCDQCLLAISRSTLKANQSNFCCPVSDCQALLTDNDLWTIKWLNEDLASQIREKIGEKKDNIETNETCGICFETPQGTNYFVNLSCKQSLCSNCLTSWRKTNNTCPFCRAEISSVKAKTESDSSDNQWQFTKKYLLKAFVLCGAIGLTLYQAIKSLLPTTTPKLLGGKKPHNQVPQNNENYTQPL